jgi:hypothetical protein
VDRYSFLVRLFHPLLHAGLPRRTNIAVTLLGWIGQFSVYEMACLRHSSMLNQWCAGSRFGCDGLSVGYLHQARSVVGSRPTGALARGPVAQVFCRGTCPRTYTNSRRQGSCNDAAYHFSRLFARQPLTFLLPSQFGFASLVTALLMVFLLRPNLSMEFAAITRASFNAA